MRPEIKKLLILNAPYLLFVYLFDKVGAAVRLSPGMDASQKYIGYIVSFDNFFLVQGEKSRRSNIDENTNKRKTSRYNSQSVLSGLLVCTECNHNYRRITRLSGEVVWHCASRVEHGKKFCKHSPSIS